MLPKAELKLETGEVIPLCFGMHSKIRYCEYIEELQGEDGDINSPTLDVIKADAKAAKYNMLIVAMIIASAAECARVIEGNFDKVGLKEAIRWIMLAGDIEAEQVQKALKLNTIFSESGEQKEATPPKKRSAGKKSKVSQ